MVATFKPVVEVLPDSAALIGRALELTLESIQQGLQTQQRCSIALAGGNTPKPLYEALAQQDLPWSQLHIFWGDERYVPADHPDSNQRMARQAWLDQVAFPSDNIHPVSTHAAGPAAAAQQYEQDLQAYFGSSPGEFPRFDLILLGMGPDGHTASLFPQTAALEVRDRLVTVGQKADQPRITFTAPLINQASKVIFMVTGANKQTALDAVFAKTGDDRQYPSRLIRPAQHCYWLLDQAAGARLL